MMACPQSAVSSPQSAVRSQGSGKGVSRTRYTYGSPYAGKGTTKEVDDDDKEN